MALFLAVLATARAQVGSTPLDPMVVTATRLPEPVGVLGSAVDEETGSDLARQQLSTLGDALSGTPGDPAFATGQAGANTSLFMRGADSNQVLFLVDGIRMSDANTDYGSFLGGARLFPADSVEVVRGPQSTLYGSDAVGGVVSLRLAPGQGPFSGSFSDESGSYGTIDGEVTAQGADGALSYNLGIAGVNTNNDRINNNFRSGDLAARVDYRAMTYLSIGATLRGFVSRYGDPGDVYTDNPYDYETESNWLGTVFLDAELTQYVKSHLTLGGQFRDSDSYEPSPGQPTTVAEVDNRRGVIDWQNTLQLTASDRLVAGLDAEEESTDDPGYGAIDRRQTLWALYAEDEWNLDQILYLTGGIRRDDNDTFGSASTGRATAAWLPFGKVFKLRGSLGTGFNAPSILDLYGRAPGYVGNPDLQPERSRGWDFGFDLYSPGGQGTVSATAFVTEIRNLIDDDFEVDPYTTENIGRARTKGIELEYRAVLAGIVQTKLAYTRLEADDLTAGTPLLRRPHYEASGDFSSDLGKGVTVGIGAAWVGTRADIDALTYATIDDPGYAVTRAYASWQITRAWAVKARVENPLDRKYDPVDGYPALGTTFYAGATFAF